MAESKRFFIEDIKGEKEFISFVNDISKTAVDCYLYKNGEHPYLYYKGKTFTRGIPLRELFIGFYSYFGRINSEALKQLNFYPSTIGKDSAYFNKKKEKESFFEPIEDFFIYKRDDIYGTKVKEEYVISRTGVIKTLKEVLLFMNFWDGANTEDNIENTFLKDYLEDKKPKRNPVQVTTKGSFARVCTHYDIREIAQRFFNRIKKDRDKDTAFFALEVLFNKLDNKKLLELLLSKGELNVEK